MAYTDPWQTARGAFNTSWQMQQPWVRSQQRQIGLQGQQALAQTRADLARRGYLASDRAFTQERLTQDFYDRQAQDVENQARAQAMQQALGWGKLGSQYGLGQQELALREHLGQQQYGLGQQELQQRQQQSLLSALLSALGMAEQRYQFEKQFPLLVGEQTGFYNPPSSLGQNEQLAQLLTFLLGRLA